MYLGALFDTKIDTIVLERNNISLWSLKKGDPSLKALYKKETSSEIYLPGGCIVPVAIMNPIEAAREAPLASHPGPNKENANTPKAAQAI